MGILTDSLFEALPTQYAGAPAFVDYESLVPHLLTLYPEWSEQDIRSFVEEKTRRRLHPEDQTTLRAVYQRVLLAGNTPFFAERIRGA